MFAIFETGGKQYRVNEGDVIFVEKLGAEEGETVVFDNVKAVMRDNTFNVGALEVIGVKITATVLKNGKGKKIHVFKYKAKKNEKKMIGHRQPYSKVQIVSIDA